MPIASPEIYGEMLNRAKAGAFAYPAINVSSSQTLNAALQGFADAGSDGIIQISTGSAAYLSGAKVADMAVGAMALAEYAHVVAARYPVQIALHTDHSARELLAECKKAKVVLEVEIGVVGGEEDGVVGAINETAEALGTGENGRYLLAATFGNVHGVYEAGHVKLRPTVLQQTHQRGKEGRQAEAVRPRLPRRQRLAAGGDPRDAGLRRGEDEHRH